MKKRKWKIKFLIWLSVLFFGIIYFYSACILPVILSECRAKAEIFVRKTLNQCSLDVLSDKKISDSIIASSQSGGIPILSANTAEINKIAFDICASSQNILENTDNSPIGVNLGTMSGIAIFSNTGPEIKINIVPVNIVCYNYIVKTESVGINQVHYKIALEIRTVINLLIPGKPERSETVTEVLIADCILAGTVPDMVFGVKTYDLIP